MNHLWLIFLLWMVLGVPLGILGIYFLVKFIDRTNKIDEEQKRQIAINEAKIEAIKNDNDKKIKQNSKPSSWFSAFYYLILIGVIGAAFQDRNNSENVKIDNNSGNTPTKKILSDTELKQYCTLEKICKEYQKERMNCSTAGNFGTCMTIRMRKYDFNYAQFHCNDDKILGYDGYDPPGILQCFFQSE